MTEKTERHPYGSVRDAVIEWITEFPADKDFHYADIAADLGVQSPTVSAAILKLVRTEGSLVVRGSKAGWYRKLSPDSVQRAPASVPERAPQQPKTLAAGDVLEVVGVMKSGSLLLRAENGTLYEAKEL